MFACVYICAVELAISISTRTATERSKRGRGRGRVEQRTELKCVGISRQSALAQRRCQFKKTHTNTDFAVFARFDLLPSFPGDKIDWLGREGLVDNV